MRHRLPAYAPGIARAKAVSAVATAAIGAALLASCSSPSPAPADSAESQIKQVTQDYITAVNTGTMTDMPPLICSKFVHSIPGDGENLPESAKKAQVDGFEDITVSGDTATAQLAVSVIDDSTQPPAIVDMLYVDEDGWKICQ